MLCYNIFNNSFQYFPFGRCYAEWPLVSCFLSPFWNKKSTIYHFNRTLHISRNHSLIFIMVGVFLVLNLMSTLIFTLVTIFSWYLPEFLFCLILILTDIYHSTITTMGRLMLNLSLVNFGSLLCPYWLCPTHAPIARLVQFSKGCKMPSWGPKKNVISLPALCILFSIIWEWICCLLIKHASVFFPGLGDYLWQVPDWKSLISNVVIDDSALSKWKTRWPPRGTHTLRQCKPAL